MILSIKKSMIFFTLVAGMTAPAFAMDSHQESSGWFGWKTGVGVTSLVCAGIAYYAYNSWYAKPAPKRFTAKPAVYFAQPTQEQIKEIDQARTIENARSEIARQAAEKAAQKAMDPKGQAVIKEVRNQQMVDDIERFAELSLTNQKIEINALIKAYIEDGAEFVPHALRAYSHIYGKKVGSLAVANAIEKFFEVDGKKARLAEYKNIKELLGLMYY